MNASPQLSTPFLAVDGLIKRFPGVTALDRVRLEILPGEVHALAGENGAGKSTLSKLLNGVYQLDEGEIRIKRQPVQIPDPHRAQALGISTIYQERTLAPDLTPIENIFLGRELRQGGPFLDARKMRARARELWREFGGEVRDLDRRIESLGGLKQRTIEIVKALAFSSELVIMDEPTAALPDGERASLLEHIRKMRSAGVSVLLESVRKFWEHDRRGEGRRRTRRG